MSKTQRITLFVITASLLFLIFYVSTGRVFPSSEQSIVLFTALLMLSFVTLFLEHFFMTPTDVPCIYNCYLAPDGAATVPTVESRAVVLDLLRVQPFPSFHVSNRAPAARWT